MSIGVAIIGSGIFAREEHLPAVQASDSLQLKAIYSRSQKSAQDLAVGTSGIDIYSEDSGSGKSYADLLARQDIVAVIIALPILAQPGFIQKALAAGKQVLSEKPIAKDVATAQDLVAWYQANTDPCKTRWAVAENFRYLGKYIRCAEEVRKMGRVKSFRMNVQNMIKPDSKYHKTEWRRTPEYKGGFVLDGGVHMVAGLRLILGSNDPLATISAQSSLQQEHLAPVDTVDAVAKTRSGATGVLSLSYGSAFSDSLFEFACERGVVTMHFDKITANGESHEIPFEGRCVNLEVAEFAASIVEGRPVSNRLSPAEAMADLEIMEKMFDSSAQDGERMKLRFQV
ncbi:hypothetical protein ASPWEDRAFT_39268 [Aspergillus wentii DTO 134E9]|uniref:Gfo/Idh/MocA-like oxidoreductase N-terminal domain-containing protein n=1 Tax=Aspergillus wentii DTO 134E9 TaxID=1073089 RepID=A0A1L9RRL2_ASPWE|nr:uncharacterized protein ASPWEDRAFT_39268 [Aspergillus wentii DTO 134E9]OJJ37559.1 hypothetical protein ASPWEDRAFT_39268 [Aspergillus wentii DTO 134E9]